MRVVTSAEMAELDRHAIQALGTPGHVLMERAGAAVTRQLRRLFPRLRRRRVVVLAGKGNNGGDGLVIARQLTRMGVATRLALACAPRDLRGEAALNWGRLASAGVEAQDAAAFLESLPDLGASDVIVDALLGTGFRGEVRAPYAELIQWANGSPAHVVAVDIPSGVAADDGRAADPAIQADVTITLALPKQGLLVPPGLNHAGRLVVVDIGIPGEATPSREDAWTYVDAHLARELLPQRVASAHKGAAGHVLLLAGSRGMAGAAILAARGAVRCGAGLVRLGVPEAIEAVVANAVHEAMPLALPQTSAGALSMAALPLIRRWFDWADVVALGPGLGRDEETAGLVRAVLSECPRPVVVDADGLWALAGHADVLPRRTAESVLTPHPGELAHLLGSDVATLQGDRVETARRCARQWNTTLLLKGAATVVAAHDGRVSLNGSGNPGMASGGMGDVLTGVIAALAAQGLPGYDAARLGAYLHGAAADKLAGPLGWRPLCAGEVAGALGEAWRRTARPMPSEHNAPA